MFSLLRLGNLQLSGDRPALRVRRTNAQKEWNFEELNMSDTTNSYCSGFATRFNSQAEYRFAQGNDRVRGTTMKLPSIAGWYRILRAHYRFPLFQAIRYALWLAR
jgi:hypothetical protein